MLAACNFVNSHSCFTSITLVVFVGVGTISYCPATIITGMLAACNFVNSHSCFTGIALVIFIGVGTFGYCPATIITGMLAACDFVSSHSSFASVALVVFIGVIALGYLFSTIITGMLTTCRLVRDLIMTEFCYLKSPNLICIPCCGHNVNSIVLCSCNREISGIPRMNKISIATFLEHPFL